MMVSHNHKPKYSTALSVTGLIITLGIIYGDIGTSPLYVVRAILYGLPAIQPEYILGGLSCIIWTLTLLTTIKYVLITLRADNRGEGGVLALYALIRRKIHWVYIIAIIGAATLFADGVITPAITVVSSIEGLKIINPQIPVIPIVLVIIVVLFAIQQFGTRTIGKSFGPLMLIWFLMLGILGFIQILSFPAVFKSFNPYYAYKFITECPNGFILLGAVFLCTTGAEALYADLGHCGKRNIQISWIFVKTALLLNYLGQGAWVLNNLANGGIITKTTNTFFAIMPQWFLPVGIIIATIAAVIASQAVITGSYTLISEAIPLNFWPKIKINYPTILKQQMYIPGINWLLMLLCIFVIVFFQTSSNMEAAYGLSITITMVITTILLGYYLYLKKVPLYLISIFLILFLTIQGAFLVSCLYKFSQGGWFTILFAGILSVMMYIWFNGRKIHNKFVEFVKIQDYLDILKDLNKDNSIQKYATNLVYMTRANRKDELESKAIYSIINKQPKRADIYWIVHVDILDEPFIKEYEITQIIPNILIRIDFRLGFKVEPKINLYFRQVVEEMVKNKEIDITSRYESLRKYEIQGDFRFVVIDRIPTYDYDFSHTDKVVLDCYEILKKTGISDVHAFGLDMSNVLIEKVPLAIPKHTKLKLQRKQ